MKLVIIMVSALFTICSLGSVYASSDDANSAGYKVIYGYIEKVNIQPENVSLVAKLDTGADTASLDAINIKQYKKDNEEWVSFDLPAPDNQLIHFEKKVVRIANIKKRLNNNASQGATSTSRPVVMMDLCMRQQCRTIEVNLANRSNFDSQLLLGRNALIAFDAIVDPSEEFIQTNALDEQNNNLNDSNDIKDAQ
jgi:hypothetical protein